MATQAKAESTNLMSVETQFPKIPVNVEVRLKRTAAATYHSIEEDVRAHIFEAESALTCPSVLQHWEDAPSLKKSVDHISICEAPAFMDNGKAITSLIPIEQATLFIHVYQCSSFDEQEEFTSNGDDNETILAATDRELPSEVWEGLWDSLVYPDNVKLRLLDYIYSTIMLSEARVDFNIVCWNRVVLLHGPPGTGKTSLCRALAQKLSIRLKSRFEITRLLEINAHSLFSRWFSESGKLVQRLFSHINEIAMDEGCFVVVLIDEIESLTAARASVMAGNEPSDAIRVVNALLTQLDKLKLRKNVLIMATSNLVSAIDTAFLDRADIVEYVGLPPKEAVYGILRSCFVELMAKGVVEHVNIPEADEAIQNESLSALRLDRGIVASRRLLHLATLCEAMQMSGRSLRRLPVLAHTHCVGYMPSLVAHAQSTVGTPNANRVPLEAWLDAMDKVVSYKTQQHTALIQGALTKHES